jgi:hypothetical protein
VQNFGRISKEAATSAADLLSDLSTSINRARTATFLREGLRFRAVCAWLWGSSDRSVTARNGEPSESDVATGPLVATTAPIMERPREGSQS